MTIKTISSLITAPPRRFQITPPLRHAIEQFVALAQGRTQTALSSNVGDAENPFRARLVAVIEALDALEDCTARQRWPQDCQMAIGRGCGNPSVEGRVRAGTFVTLHGFVDKAVRVSKAAPFSAATGRNDLSASPVLINNVAMQVQLVMTVIGKDRTGLVESVARIVADHGGNWLESRMCRLGGEFAGILRAHVPSEHRAALEQALTKLNDLTIVVRGDEVKIPTGEPRLASLEVVGHDRPGIVLEITRALAAHGANVEELATECVSAPMSGEMLFQARAKLALPAGVTVGALRQSLEQAVPGLTIEISTP